MKGCKNTEVSGDSFTSLRSVHSQTLTKTEYVASLNFSSSTDPLSRHTFCRRFEQHYNRIESELGIAHSYLPPWVNANVLFTQRRSPLGTHMSSQWSHWHGPFSWHLSRDPSESQSSPCARVRLVCVVIYATVIPGEISVTVCVFVCAAQLPFFCTLCKTVRLVPLDHASICVLIFLFSVYVYVCVCVCVCVCVVSSPQCILGLLVSSHMRMTPGFWFHCKISLTSIEWQVSPCGHPVLHDNTQNLL